MRLLRFRPNRLTAKRIARREARAYAERLIARVAIRRLEILQAEGYMPVTVNGVCAICLGGGRILRAGGLWKRCPCSN